MQNVLNNLWSILSAFYARGEKKFPFPITAISQHIQQGIYYLLKQMTFPKSFQEL